MKLLESMRRIFRRQPNKWEPVELETNGFRLGSEQVSWSAVEEIAAFKRDMFTVDDLWLRFKVGESIVLVCEEQPGFGELEAIVIRKYPSAATWRQRVVLPPFQENYRVLYRAP